MQRPGFEAEDVQLFLVTGSFREVSSESSFPSMFSLLGTTNPGFAMENILASARSYEPSFYRTGAGAEIDLVLRRGRRVLAFELKSSTVPSVTKGFWSALEDISPDDAYVVAPVKDAYPIKHGVKVTPLPEIIARLDRDR